MKRPRFSIGTLMLVVALVALAAWNGVLLGRLDDQSRELILGLVAVVVAYPTFIVLFARVATLFGRWAPKGEARQVGRERPGRAHPLKVPIRSTRGALAPPRRVDRTARDGQGEVRLVQLPDPGVLNLRRTLEATPSRRRRGVCR